MPITDEDRPSNQLVLKLAGVRELQAARGVLGGRSRPVERDFNEHGAAGWEFCAVADGYAIFKRPTRV
jgi:hypothetical protein